VLDPEGPPVDDDPEDDSAAVGVAVPEPALPWVPDAWVPPGAVAVGDPLAPEAESAPVTDVELTSGAEPGDVVEFDPSATGGFGPEVGVDALVTRDFFPVCRTAGLAGPVGAAAAALADVCTIDIDAAGALVYWSMAETAIGSPAVRIGGAGGRAAAA
jgi:hypothetical protein